MENILNEIRKEREYQKERWGNETDDTLNTPWMWASYIAQYATKWMAGTFAPLSSDTVNTFRKCMVKVATLAIAAIESIDRQRQENTQTFYEG